MICVGHDRPFASGGGLARGQILANNILGVFGDCTGEIGAEARGKNGMAYYSYSRIDGAWGRERGGSSLESIRQTPGARLTRSGMKSGVSQRSSSARDELRITGRILSGGRQLEVTKVRRVDMGGVPVRG